MKTFVVTLKKSNAPVHVNADEMQLLAPTFITLRVNRGQSSGNEPGHIVAVFPADAVESVVEKSAISSGT